MAKGAKLHRRSAALLAGAFAAATALAVAQVYWLGPALREWRAGERPSPGKRAVSTPFLLPSVRRPPAVAAADAAVPDGIEVLGVTAGGRHRAYVVYALKNPRYHVVNDVVGGVPVTVTHCDLTGCSRAFTGPPPDGPLDLSVAGLGEGRLLILARGAGYRQDDPALPCPDYPLERTTWGAWRAAHPDTDVFVGEIPDADAGAR